jgi:hypothetical protein
MMGTPVPVTDEPARPLMGKPVAPPKMPKMGRARHSK